MKINRFLALLFLSMIHGSFIVSQDTDTQAVAITDETAPTEITETTQEAETPVGEDVGDVTEAEVTDEVEAPVDTSEPETVQDVEEPIVEDTGDVAETEDADEVKALADTSEPETVQDVEEPVVEDADDVTETETSITQESDIISESITDAVDEVVSKTWEVELPEIEDEDSPMPVEEDQEEGIIDTMEIDDNVNWLEVRKYLQDAIVLLEQISVAFSQVSDLRMQYLQQRNTADQTFDTFMKDVGVDLGELYQQVTSYIDRLSQERIEDGDLSVDERALLDSLNENKTSLDQLQQDIVSLLTIDSAIDDILMTAEQQISTSRDYQNQAWQSFQKLETTPQKAEDLYAKIDAAYKNVQQLYAYLQGDLMQYLTNTIATLNSQISAVQSQLKTLQTAGVSLGKQLKTLEQLDEQEEQKAQQERFEEQTEEAVDAAVEAAVQQEHEKAKQRSIMGHVKRATSWVVDKIGVAWTATKNLFNLTVSTVTGSSDPHSTEGFHAPTDIGDTPTQMPADTNQTTT